MAEGQRHSGIRHPAGGRYIRLDLWAVEELGHAGAATLSVLEFWDHLRDERLEWMQRDVADLVDALKGLYARDKVRAARRALMARGWLEEDRRTVLIGQLYKPQTWVRLRTDKINAWIEEKIDKSKQCEKSHSGNAKNRTPEVRKIASTTNSTSTSISSPTPQSPAPQAGDSEPAPAGSGGGEGGGGQEKENPQAEQGEGVGLEGLEALQEGLAAQILPLLEGLPLARRQALLDRLVGDVREGGVKAPARLLQYWIREGAAWAQSPAGEAVARARLAAQRVAAARQAKPEVDLAACAKGAAILARVASRRAARRDSVT